MHNILLIKAVCSAYENELTFYLMYSKYKINRRKKNSVYFILIFNFKYIILIFT